MEFSELHWVEFFFAYRTKKWMHGLRMFVGFNLMSLAKHYSPSIFDLPAAREKEAEKKKTEYEEKVNAVRAHKQSLTI